MEKERTSERMARWNENSERSKWADSFISFEFFLFLSAWHSVCIFSCVSFIQFFFLQINVYDVSRWICNSIIERQTKHYYFLWFAFMKNRMRHKHQRNEIQWIFSVPCLKSNWKSLIHKSMCSFRSFLSFVVANDDWSCLRHYRFFSLDFLLTTNSNTIITIQPASRHPASTSPLPRYLTREPKYMDVKSSAYTLTLLFRWVRFFRM